MAPFKGGPLFKAGPFVGRAPLLGRLLSRWAILKLVSLKIGPSLAGPYSLQVIYLRWALLRMGANEAGFF